MGIKQLAKLITVLSQIGAVDTNCSVIADNNKGGAVRERQIKNYPEKQQQKTRRVFKNTVSCWALWSEGRDRCLDGPVPVFGVFPALELLFQKCVQL